jgi:hypothetical protein
MSMQSMESFADSRAIFHIICLIQGFPDGYNSFNRMVPETLRINDE